MRINPNQVNNKNFIEKSIEREPPSLLLYFILFCIAVIFILIAMYSTENLWQNLFLSLGTNLMVIILVLIAIEQKFRRPKVNILLQINYKIQFFISLFFPNKNYQFSLYLEAIRNRFDLSILNSLIIDRPTDHLVLKATNNLIVWGEPGTGKTLLLIRFFIMKLDSALENRGEKVPLFIRLSSVNPKENLLEIFLKEMRHYSYISERNFNNHLKNGQFVFILDGLDESLDPLSTIHQILTIINSYPQCQILVSSRRIDLLEILLEKFELIQIPSFTEKETNQWQNRLFAYFFSLSSRIYNY